MRKLPAVLGIIALAALLAFEAYDFVVTNEGLRYYAAKPQRLIFLVAIGIVGGLEAFFFSRLSLQVQRWMKLTVLAAAGLLVASTAAILVYCIVSFPEMVLLKERILIGLAVLVMAAFAAMIWYEFGHVWKTGRTRFM